MTTDIKQEVLSNYRLFDEFTLRQDYDASCHKDTKCIFLRGPKGVTKDAKEVDRNAFFDSTEFYDWPSRPNFPLVNKLINEYMRGNGLTDLGWVTIVSLKPYGMVAPHPDQGAYCVKYNRYHYPIIAEKSIFIVDDEPFKMQEGKFYTYDNQRVHSAVNMSSKERIHLIFDAL